MDSPSASLPKITVTYGTHSSILKTVQEVDEYLASGMAAPDEEEEDSGDTSEFWEGIKDQLIEIAKLTYQTDQFQCKCSRDDCPFQGNGAIQNGSYHSPSLLRRQSAPITGYSQYRKDVSYGGLQSFLTHNNDFEIEDNDGSASVAPGNSPFLRRRGIALRRGNKKMAAPSATDRAIARLSLPPVSLSSLDSIL